MRMAVVDEMMVVMVMMVMMMVMMAGRDISCEM